MNYSDAQLAEFARSFFRISQEVGGPCSGQCAPQSNKQFMNRLEKFTDLRKFLDIGAGTGGWAGYLRDMGKKVVETDLHPRDSSVIEADMHLIPLNDGSFDGVLASHVFEHSVSPLLFMFEIKRLLKPNGLAFITFPYEVERWIKDSNHVSVLTKLQFENIAEKAGMVIIDSWLSSEGGSELTELKDYRGDMNNLMQFYILQKAIL